MPKENIPMEKKRLPLKPGILKRPRIQNILSTGPAYPLVTVMGGPGYGKTQAVSRFASTMRQRLIWLNLTRLDNNIDHFWNTLTAAVSHDLPDFAAILRRHSFPGSLREFDRHIIEASGALEFSEDTVFVIDNYSVLTKGPTRTFLEDLIRMQLARLCIILISSRAEDECLAEALVGRDHLQLTTETLRFTREEVHLMLQSFGLAADEQGVDRIMAETKGWPMAVYLVCQQCAEGGIWPKGGSFFGLPALDHLFENGFFQNYPKYFRRALVCFASLPSFSHEMAPFPPRERAALLDECLRNNVFVFYDCNSKTCTFHPMYQHFLRQKHYILADAEMTDTCKRAGDWFCNRGIYLEAVDCYYNCGYYDEMVAAILMLVATSKDIATVDYMLAHMEKLPRYYLEATPKARFCTAFLCMNRMELQKARALLEGVEQQLLEGGDEDDQLLGEVYALWADICLIMNDAACFDYCSRAAGRLKNGSAYHNRQLLRLGNNNVLFLPGVRPGLLRQTVERMHENAQHTARYMNGQGYGLEYLFAAEAAYATCDVTATQENCHRAIFRAMKEEQHDIVCNAYYVLLRCALYTGDGAALQQALDALADNCSRHKLDALCELYDSAKGWLYLKLEMPERVACWIAKYDNDRYANQPLTMGRNKIIHAHYLLEEGRHLECLAYLDGMEWMYREKGLWTVRLHHYILKAICLVCTGNSEEAVRQLHHAYAMAHANHILICFIEYGNRMLALLDLAAKQNKFAFSPKWLGLVKEKAALYAEQVLRIKKERYGESERQPSKVRLSKREYEVLYHIVHGKTRSEIAKELGIAENSVKTHITGAYSKLGAVNRADATRLAIGLGIFKEGA